jgi:hypothetical protein
MKLLLQRIIGLAFGGGTRCSQAAPNETKAPQHSADLEGTSTTPNVRFGSEAAVDVENSDVCSALKSRRAQREDRCLFSARIGHQKLTR